MIEVQHYFMQEAELRSLVHIVMTVHGFPGIQFGGKACNWCDSELH